MLNQKPKVFWKDVSVIDLSGEDASPAAQDIGTRFGVALDGRPVRVPSKAPLSVPTRALADAIADEWRAQGDVIDPFSMPLTQLANTAQDRVRPLRASIIEELLGHVDTDTVCYYADEPADLVDRQHAAWTPVHAWAQDVFGVQWQTTSGIMPVSQAAEVHAAMARALDLLSDEDLAAYQVIAPATASALIGLAVLNGRLTAEQAFAAAAVDELFQAELWGEDWEAKDRRDRLMADLASAERFLLLARATEAV